MKRGARGRTDPLELALAGIPARIEPSEIVVPHAFTAFCDWLNVRLFPGQRVLAAVCFDRVQPRDLAGEERKIARALFGDVESFSEEERRYIVAVCGARAGKTYIIIALRILHLALTVALDTLAPGEVASAPIIAPDKELAKQAINYIGGAIRSKPELARIALGKTEDTESIDIRRGTRIVEIVVRAASAKGQTGRGRSLVGAALDEAAFFRDKDYKVNDEEIYRALSPRILPGGQLIIASTPWAQVGLLYDMFVANHPEPRCANVAFPAKLQKTAIAVHAATLKLRDTPLTREIVSTEERRDEENASREYGAQFMSAGVTVFFDAETIAKCIDATLTLPILPQPGDEVTSGGDLGFAKNSSALAIAHWRDAHVTLAALEEVKPQEGSLLKPSEVISDYALTIAEHGGTAIMADGHYKASAVEYLGDEGVGFIDAPTAPAEAFIAARTIMREGRAKIPNEPRLIRQLQETMCKRSSGGHMSIVLPLWKTGEHGDLAQAMVLAFFQKAGDLVRANEARDSIEVQEENRREARRRELAGGEGWDRWRATSARELLGRKRR